MATILECVAGPPKGKRIEVVPGKPLPFKIRKHEQDAGQVVVEMLDDQCVVTNRSQLPCLINGEARSRSVLHHGDELVIGKNTFRVHVAEPDAESTQQLDRLVLDVAGATGVCSVCDGPYVAQHGWSDGERRICRRCLVKGVRPEHLPRAPTPPSFNPDGETTVMPRRPDSSGNHRAAGSDSGNHRPAGGDSGNRRAADSSGNHRAAADSGVQRAADDRHAKRISASRLSVVEPEGQPGIMKKVTSMLVTGRGDRQRLAQLEQERQRLLIEAGRLSLGSGGGLGLSETALLALLAGRKVTLGPDDLSWSVLDQWRSQRERIQLLDAEITALRRACGLGSDHGSILPPAPPLRPEVKEQKERAFHTLDAIPTEDLGEVAADAQTTAATRPQPPAQQSSPVKVVKPNSSGRRRPHRR